MTNDCIVSFWDWRQTPTVPGSRLVACARCGTRLWFAPISIDYFQRGYQPICEGCLISERFAALKDELSEGR
jgi:hypothetical protein